MLRIVTFAHFYMYLLETDIFPLKPKFYRHTLKISMHKNNIPVILKQTSLFRTTVSGRDDTRAGTPSSKIPHHIDVLVGMQHFSVELGFEPGTLWPQLLFWYFSNIKFISDIKPLKF